jgi:hypothetical protein
MPHEACLDRPLIALASVQTHLHTLTSTGGCLLHESHNSAQLARADYQVHVRRTSEDCPLVFLRHAAQYADDCVRVVLLHVLQPTQGTVDFVLSMLADTARIEEDRVGFSGVVNEFISSPHQLGSDQLAVEHVHLATDRLDVEAFGHGKETLRQAARSRSASFFLLTDFLRFFSFFTC